MPGIRIESDRNWATIETVTRIAKDIGASPVQVALSWLIDRPGVTAPIVGARTVQHITDALSAADVALDAEATSALEKVSAPTPGGYPYGNFGAGQRERSLQNSAQSLGSLVGRGSHQPLGRV